MSVSVCLSTSLSEFQVLYPSSAVSWSLHIISAECQRSTIGSHQSRWTRRHRSAVTWHPQRCSWARSSASSSGSASHHCSLGPSECDTSPLATAAAAAADRCHLHRQCTAIASLRSGELIDWVVALRPTRHKIGHFGAVSPSQSLGSVWKKTKYNATKARIQQSKQMYYNTK